ncbi:MAG: hypothetical protein MUP41_05995, partial [Desulfobacterales bacterium]|nr:hypothetical protein [Desulfobacterales bacterium]
MKEKRNGIVVSALLLSFLWMVATVGVAAEKPMFLGFAGGPATGVYGKAAAAISIVLKDKSGGSISATSQAT